MLTTLLLALAGMSFVAGENFRICPFSNEIGAAAVLEVVPRHVASTVPRDDGRDANAFAIFASNVLPGKLQELTVLFNSGVVTDVVAVRVLTVTGLGVALSAAAICAGDI